MRRLFKKGDHVRSKINGNVMEVLKYVTENLLEVKSFDVEKREVYTNRISQSNIQKF